MAIKLIEREWHPELNDYKHDYVCDAEADVSTLPESCCGSSALVIETGDVYVVNTQGVWTKVGD